jgi:deoxyxylulose-5-phosphate synthase
MVFCLDNHYVTGGQGSIIASEIAAWDIKIPVKRLGITQDLPPYGTHEQVLRACSLDHESISNLIFSSIHHEHSNEKSYCDNV